MTRLTLLIASLPLCLLLAGRPAAALPVPERLVYEVSWAGIQLGTAVYEVTQQNEQVRIAFRVQTSKWLRHILAINNQEESLLLPPGATPLYGLPMLFRENVHTGKTRTLKEASFDHDRLTVRTRDLLNKTEKIDPITPRTFDSISSIYFIRSSELAPGSLILIDMFDCKRLYNTEVRVVRREELDSAVGRFRTVVVKSVLKHGGQVNKTGGMTAWFSDDERRIPVRMEVKLKLGQFTAQLAGGSYWP